MSPDVIFTVHILKGAIMSQYWEDRFNTWVQPPGQTEQDKCDNTIQAIKDAVSNYVPTSRLDIEVFPHGSYKANTNVRTDSDVDVCVCLKNTFFYHLPTGRNDPSTFGIMPATTEYAALVNKFGQPNVMRGNKAFDIHANTYRVDADVVATFEYRHYTGKFRNDVPVFHTGVKLQPDNGNSIINWPHHNYGNGVQKNNDTGRRYKSVIRILKRLRNEMQANNIVSSQDINSFLIESLVWNAPNNHFNGDNYFTNIEHVIGYCATQTTDYDKCKEWGEVNEMKYLFGSHQRWTSAQATRFMLDTWSYLGLGN